MPRRINPACAEWWRPSTTSLPPLSHVACSTATPAPSSAAGEIGPAARFSCRRRVAGPLGPSQATDGDDDNDDGATTTLSGPCRPQPTTMARRVSHLDEGVMVWKSRPRM